MFRRSDHNPPASLAGADTSLVQCVRHPCSGASSTEPLTPGFAFMGGSYPDPGAFVFWP